MSEKKAIGRAAGVLGGATLLSRIAGLVRDMVVARLFGASLATDAFFMAFTIPNLLRRFFAEGSLTAAFVPVFSEVYQRQGKQEAARVANACWTLLLLVMAAVTLAGILFSPWIVKGIGYGFGAVEGKLALTDLLNRIMFPYIFFVSLLALITGILNVLGHFFLPALSPVLLNLSMVGCALVLSPRLEVPIAALAIGVLAGGAVQLLIQFPVLARHGMRLRPDFGFAHPAVRKVTRLMLPGLIGVAIYQINVVVTRLLASFLAEGSVSYLYYGQRLFEFPQGILLVSLGQAVLPAMSRQAAAGDREALKDSLRFALCLILVGILPATVGLIQCAVPVYGLFFMGDEFTADAVRQSALALAAYAPGLLFVGGSRIVVPTFYALKDTRTPVLISFWTLVVNVGFGLLLMGPLGHVGLALALTLASLFNCVALVWALRRKIGPLGLAAPLRSLGRIGLSTAAMAAAVHIILQPVAWTDPGGTLYKGAMLALAVFCGGSLYGASCWGLRIPEARRAVQLVRDRLQGRKG